MGTHLKAGDQAPDFAAPATDGGVLRLADFRGRKLVLYFYPMDDTPGCTKESCGFRDDFSELKKLGVTVFGVSKDDLKSHDAFIKKYRLPFVLLSDPDKKMMTAYQAWGEKKMYGVTTIGTIRSTVVIDSSGKIIKHWMRVPKAEDHPHAVLAFIKTLHG